MGQETSETLKIAIQKSGRLYEGSMQLLKECGIEVSNGNNQLRVISGNFPVEVFFLRDDDIPEYVQDAVADIGFVGENVVMEKNKAVEVIEKLGFGKCRLSIAVPKNGQFQSINDLEGQIERGEFGELLNWLRAKVHRHGRRFRSEELCTNITGMGLNFSSFMSYIEWKYAGIYGLPSKSDVA